MEIRTEPYSYLQQEHLREELGFSRMNSIYPEGTVDQGDEIELLDSFGEVTQWRITGRQQTSIQANKPFYHPIGEQIGKEELGRFLIDTSEFARYDIGWRYSPEQIAQRTEAALEAFLARTKLILQ